MSALSSSSLNGGNRHQFVNYGLPPSDDIYAGAAEQPLEHIHQTACLEHQSLHAISSHQSQQQAQMDPFKGEPLDEVCYMDASSIEDDSLPVAHQAAMAPTAANQRIIKHLGPIDQPVMQPGCCPGHFQPASRAQSSPYNPRQQQIFPQDQYLYGQQQQSEVFHQSHHQQQHNLQQRHHPQQLSHQIQHHQPHANQHHQQQQHQLPHQHQQQQHQPQQHQQIHQHQPQHLIHQYPVLNQPFQHFHSAIAQSPTSVSPARSYVSRMDQLEFESMATQRDPIIERLNVLMKQNIAHEEVLRSSHNKQEDAVCTLLSAQRVNNQIKMLESKRASGVILSHSEQEQLDNSRQDLKQVQMDIPLILQELKQMRTGVLAEQMKILKELYYIRDEVIFKNLKKWIQDQQRASNANPTGTTAGSTTAPITTTSSNTNHNLMSDYSLDRIDCQVKLMIDIVLGLKKQAFALQHAISTSGQLRCFNIDNLMNLRVCIDKFIEGVILNSFVVEKQPPQVMKTNTRFTSSVRFLCGTKFCSNMNPAQVRATIISESVARNIIQRHKELVERSWQPYVDYWGDFESSLAASSSSNNNNNNSKQHLHHMSSSQQQNQSGTNHTHPFSGQTITSTMAPHSSDNSISFSEIGMPDINSQMSPQSPATSSMHSVIQHPNQPASQESVAGPHSPPQFFQQQPQQQYSVAMTTDTPPQQQAQMIVYPAQTEFNTIDRNSIRQRKVIDVSQTESSGDIANNTQLLEIQEATGIVSCNFRNMQLKKIKRTEKKGSESVMDEKCILLFQAEFRNFSAEHDPSGETKAMDETFHLMAFSLPVVAIVHGNQEPHAWATVTWHNAFARPDDLLYQVPERVTWSELGQVLSEKFRSCAGKGLNEQNLNYLASKICRKNQPNGKETQVSWSQFAKESLPDRTFTFWEWFYSILKLTREHLQKLWAADRIYGFIGKSGCLKLLSEDAVVNGTFLLRFSETEQGGITIAWLTDSNSSLARDIAQSVDTRRQQNQSPTYGYTAGGKKVYHLHPYVSADLKTRPLADRIRDFSELSYLYPHIPKDEAFRIYYTPIADDLPTVDGYIKPMLVQTLVTKYPQASNNSSTNSAGNNGVNTHSNNTNDATAIQYE